MPEVRGKHSPTVDVTNLVREIAKAEPGRSSGLDGVMTSSESKCDEDGSCKVDWSDEPHCTFVCAIREDWDQESVYRIREDLTSERVELLAMGVKPTPHELELYWDSLAWSENAYMQYPWAKVYKDTDGRGRVKYGIEMVDGLSPGLMVDWVERTFKSVDEVLEYLKADGYQPRDLG